MDFEKHLDKVTDLPRSRQHHLPTQQEVLCFYRYHHEVLQETVQASCKLVPEDLIEIWNEAGYTHQAAKNVIRRLKKLITEWKNVQKNCCKTGLMSKVKRQRKN